MLATSRQGPSKNPAELALGLDGRGWPSPRGPCQRPRPPQPSWTFVQQILVFILSIIPDFVRLGGERAGRPNFYAICSADLRQRSPLGHTERRRARRSHEGIQRILPTTSPRADICGAATSSTRPQRPPPFGCEAKNDRSPMAPLPRPKSSSAATTWSRSKTSTRPYRLPSGFPRCAGSDRGATHHSARDAELRWTGRSRQVQCRVLWQERPTGSSLGRLPGATVVGGPR